MCGIWFYLTKSENSYKILTKYEPYYTKLKPRGPDMTRQLCENNMCCVFHRLSINDLNPTACMPFEYNNDILLCNGEIYNYKQLIDKYQFKMNTSCDCEVILHLYKLSKESTTSNDFNTIIYQLCNQLDGEFAFIIYDKTLNRTICARDAYGVRPLFIGIKNNYNDSIIGINEYEDIILSSELKGINDKEFHTSQFKCGNYAIFDSIKLQLIEYKQYTSINSNYQLVKDNLLKPPDKPLYKKIKELFIDAVEKRVKNSDRQVACLLSGGLDSSLVASIASRYFEPYTLETYCIGLKDSPDMIAAQKVADFIKSKHTNIVITEEQMLNAVHNVIKVIESYDTTTVRASVSNYLVAKYISENSQAKVLLTGEYSDEICFSYIYSKYMEDEEIFYKENYRLVNDIQYYDSLRADRVISGNGLEARVPFSDRKFVEYIMNIHPSAKMPKNSNNIEKYILRSAFDDGETLPYEILWRTKEAFSDGISTQKKSWYEILQEYIDTQISDKEYKDNKDKYTHISIKNKEMYYYVKIFDKYYNTHTIIPYLWVPRDKNGNIFTHEPSARILYDIYMKEIASPL